MVNQGRKGVAPSATCPVDTFATDIASFAGQDGYMNILLSENTLCCPHSVSRADVMERIGEAVDISVQRVSRHT